MDMSRLLAALLFLVSALPAAGHAQTAPLESPAVDPIVEVRAAFETYRRALVARDGVTAVEAVTAGTVAFFDECRRAALSMPRAQLESRDVIFRYTVFELRSRPDAARLRDMSGRDVFVRAVQEGQVGANIASFRVGAVEVSGDAATVELRASGGSMPITLRREGSTWRLDIVELVRRSSVALGRMAANLASGDENAGIFRLLQMTTQRPTTETLWSPVPAP